MHVDRSRLVHHWRIGARATLRDADARNALRSHGQAKDLS
jgi:hypothetical protein